ncbi:MAG TPA: 2-phospho-L-lactate guanylyltransferase [Xanthobacteraceae bacterium]|nr:2-phospho-L-lactate guanylyltransferase [Xanthobacteraceae bacterium]
MKGQPDIWAVIPVKETATAKERLAEAVPRQLRPGLALAMLEDVLAAVAKTLHQGSGGLAGIAVVTLDPDARALAQRYGARVLTEDARGGHTAAVAAAARTLAQEGHGGMLQMPGDIPLVSADEISLLLAMRRASPSFTIAPSHDDFGSNAVLVCPPTAVPLTFGDDSFYPHLRAAQACGLKPLIVRQPGIGLDIDRPEDIWAFAQLRSRTRAHAFLERHGLTERKHEPNGAVA